MLIISLVLKQPRPKMNKTYLKKVSLLSILGLALGQGLFLTGLKWTSSVNSALITSCIPIWTLIIVVLRGQELLTFNRLIGILMAFFGMLFMRDITYMSLSNESFMGDIFVLAATFCFSLYLSFGKDFFEHNNNYWATTIMFFISGTIIIIFKIPLILELKNIVFDQEFLICALYSVLGATLLTYLLNNWSLKKTQAANVALFIYLQPVVAAVIGYYYLGEVITMRMLLCSFFILLGLIFSVISTKSP